MPIDEGVCGYAHVSDKVDYSSQVVIGANAVAPRVYLMLVSIKSVGVQFSRSLQRRFSQHQQTSIPRLGIPEVVYNPCWGIILLHAA